VFDVMRWVILARLLSNQKSRVCGEGRRGGVVSACRRNKWVPERKVEEEGKIEEEDKDY